MVSKFYSKINRKDLQCDFLFEGEWIEWGGIGCFLKFESTLFVKVIRLCISFKSTLRVVVFYIMGSWGAILGYAVSTCGKKQTCLLFASCLESNKFQVTTHTERLVLQWMSKHELIKLCFLHSQEPRAQLPFSKVGGLFRSDAPSAHSALDQAVCKI